ncbi:MAG: hypothetical protein ACHQVS_02095 [Candidatus Babeliales bacterium]
MNIYSWLLAGITILSMGITQAGEAISGDRIMRKHPVRMMQTSRQHPMLSPALLTTKKSRIRKQRPKPATKDIGVQTNPIIQDRMLPRPTEHTDVGHNTHSSPPSPHPLSSTSLGQKQESSDVLHLAAAEIILPSFGERASHVKSSVLSERDLFLLEVGAKLARVHQKNHIALNFEAIELDAFDNPSDDRLDKEIEQMGKRKHYARYNGLVPRLSENKHAKVVRGYAQENRVWKAEQDQLRKTKQAHKAILISMSSR